MSQLCCPGDILDSQSKQTFWTYFDFKTFLKTLPWKTFQKQFLPKYLKNHYRNRENVGVKFEELLIYYNLLTWHILTSLKTKKGTTAHLGKLSMKTLQNGRI